MLSILSIKVQPAFLESFSPPVSVLGAQSWKNDAIPPKLFNSLETNSKHFPRVFVYCPSITQRDPTRAQLEEFVDLVFPRIVSALE